MTANPHLADPRPVYGASRAPVPALTVVEASLWSHGTEAEMAVAGAAVGDRDLEAAMLDASCWTPLELAQRVSRAKGLFVPASVIADRIGASPHLQEVQQEARRRAMQEAFGKADELKRQLEVLQAQRRERNHGPRCGSRTRAGSPCQRKVVLGRTRCPRHGGKPLTEEARARIVEAQRKRWAAYRRTLTNALNPSHLQVASAEQTSPGKAHVSSKPPTGAAPIELACALSGAA